jgi:hypothetical protein
LLVLLLLLLVRVRTCVRALTILSCFFFAVAPEVIAHSKYDFSCDIWSAGVMYVPLVFFWDALESDKPLTRPWITCCRLIFFSLCACLLVCFGAGWLAGWRWHVSF